MPIKKTRVRFSAMARGVVMWLLPMAFLMSSSLYGLGASVSVIEHQANFGDTVTGSFRIYTQKDTIFVDVRNWTIDLNDIDRVLRVESYTPNVANVIALLNNAGFTCEELLD